MLQYEITYETKEGQHLFLLVESESLPKAARFADRWLAKNKPGYYCITEIKEHIYQ